MNDSSSGVKATLLIFFVIVFFLLYSWHKSEDNRSALLEELNEAKDRIEELEEKVKDLNETVSWYEDNDE